MRTNPNETCACEMCVIVTNALGLVAPEAKHDWVGSLVQKWNKVLLRRELLIDCEVEYAKNVVEKWTPEEVCRNFRGKPSERRHPAKAIYDAFWHLFSLDSRGEAKFWYWEAPVEIRRSIAESKYQAPGRQREGYMEEMLEIARTHSIA